MRRRQFIAMCNSYRIAPKRGTAKGVRARISAAAERLDSPLVRKSDSGIVVLPDRRVERMRWGFSRSFNESINNARSDKLESGMWAEAFRDRRCVIPVTLFYEWGPGTGSRKQAYEFHRAGDDYLWLAGVWEEDPRLGPCYSMVTTTAAPVMERIHNRMPAILGGDDEALAFLCGGPWQFAPYRGDLTVTPCASPLARPKPEDDQPELF
jgi:putative SOS response-associated peptidase YedK